jgi:hypothetical protein
MDLRFSVYPTGFQHSSLKVHRLPVWRKIDTVEESALQFNEESERPDNRKDDSCDELGESYFVELSALAGGGRARDGFCAGSPAVPPMALAEGQEAISLVTLTESMDGGLHGYISMKVYAPEKVSNTESASMPLHGRCSRLRSIPSRSVDPVLGSSPTTAVTTSHCAHAARSPATSGQNAVLPIAMSSRPSRAAWASGPAINFTRLRQNSL